jgi:hypothetical protein
VHGTCQICFRLNGILTFGCYTPRNKRRRDEVKRIRGMRSIDKDWEETYNRSLCVGKERRLVEPDSIQTDDSYRI